MNPRSPAGPEIFARAETIAISDHPTLVFEKLADGKIRATSTSFAPEGVTIGRAEVLDARWLSNGIRLARKDRLPDDKDRPMPAYDPYGPGEDDI